MFDEAAMSDVDSTERKFPMHTAPGSQRVARLIERVTSKLRSRREVVIMLRTGLMSIERRFPEVRSNGVRESICLALAEYCDLAHVERVNNSEF
jgi:hypothetical protein